MTNNLVDLVFEGGGAKGMVFVGAMEVFEKKGFQPGRLLGTSAGAITATLLAAGYSSQEMLEALKEKITLIEVGKEKEIPIFSAFMGVPNRKQFMPDDIDQSVMIGFLKDIDVPLVPEWAEKKVGHWLIENILENPTYCHLFSFVEKGGWYVANRFVEWLEEKLDAKEAGFSQMTMREFFDRTKKHLTLIAADTTDSRMLILNHTTAPDLPVTMAVRMSMSIPFLWQEVVWENAWGQYHIPNFDSLDLTGHTIVDGGLLSNFPIELFVSKDDQVTKVMGETDAEDVMGMLIDESLEVPGITTQEEEKSRLMSLRTVQRVMNLVNTMTSAHDKMVMEEFADLIVRLPAKSYGTTEFDMSDKRREALLEAGRQTMENYLKQREKDSEESSGILESAALPASPEEKATRRAINILAR